MLYFSCTLVTSHSSSFIQPLYHCRTHGYKGKVFVKGRPRNLEEFVKKSSYSTYEDPTLQNLKVFESMRLASRLKFFSARINDFFIQTDVRN